jgi:amino acid adenylation domain-containing protein
MRSVIDSYPLSPLQEGMLFNALFAPHSGVDITQIICRMHHSLDVPAFERAWNAVVARHAILRTAFRWEGLHEPVQDVYDEVELEFVVHDVTGLPPAEQSARLEAHLGADRRRGFDISKAPLIRVAVFLVSPAENILVWPLHHLTLDANAFALVLKEIFAIYEASLEGTSVALGTPPPYRTYIDWLQKQDAAEAEKFWRELLKGFTTPLSLSVAHDPAKLSKAKQSYGKKEIVIAPGVKGVLKPFAKENGCTLYTCFQAAWSIILGRYTGARDVVFASVRGCRGVPIDDAGSIIGMFINTLPVRGTIDERKPLVSFLKELRAQHIATRAYEHSSLAKIQQWSEVPAGMPLFESLLSYETRPWSSILTSLGGDYTKREWEVRNQTNMPIGLDIYEEPETRIVVDYDRALFDDAGMEAMLGHYRTLLEGMASDPGSTIGDLPMLTEKERRSILVEWNETESDFPRDETIHGIFETRAAETPDAPAVSLGETTLTYAELNMRANNLAHRLMKLGIGPDVPVAVCMSRSPDLIVALIGILKAGGAYVPMDPSYPRERLAFMLEDTNAPVLITEKTLAEALPGHRARTILMDADRNEIAGERGDNPSSGAGPGNLAYIIYTSGSTGLPKGVCIRHESVLNLFADFDRRKTIAPGERCSLWTSVSFDVSVYEIFTPLLAGGALFIASDAVRFDSAAFIDWLNGNRIASAYVPPLMLEDLRAWIEKHRGALSLRRLLVGVEPIREKLLAAMMEMVPGLVIVNGYGPTEATICATLFTVRPEAVRDRNTPIGRPAQNSRVLLLDAAMRPVPVGIPGEIHIGGRGLAREYFKRPELTAERFVPDPFTDTPGARLYKTGDMARFLADGCIEFIGRVDYQVKVRGFRVEPGEIEFALRQHPSVKDAVVLAKGDRTGVKRLVAYLVPAGPTAGASELRAFLKEKLPDYMVPTTFVTMEAFPLTPNGKLDRAALPEPEITRADIQSKFVAPRTEIEHQLSLIWEKVIGIEPIGVTDSFFDLGGHSLLAVRLFTEITRVFGTDLPLAAIFQHPTIEQIAALISGRGLPQAGDSLVAIRSSGSRPPLFFMHAFGGGVFFYRELSDNLGPDQPFYGLQSVGLDGKRPLHERVEEMAAHYIREIKKVRPKGPYYLGGRCLGAYVALEMANLLHAQGETIGLLAVLDSYWTPQEPPALGRGIMLHLRSLSGLSFREKRDYLVEHWGYRLIKTKIWLTRIVSRLCFALGRAVPRFMMDFYINVYIPEMNGRVERRYVPAVYPGLITFFQATAEIERDPRTFWGRLTSEGIEVIMVPASHRDILVEPNVHVLAEKLRLALEKSREGI